MDFLYLKVEKEQIPCDDVWSFLRLPSNPSRGKKKKKRRWAEVFGDRERHVTGIDDKVFFLELAKQGSIGGPQSRQEKRRKRKERKKRLVP